MKFAVRIAPFFLFLGALYAQPGICTTTATPVIVRSEGLAERTGDLVYTCTGTPNSSFTANLTFSLNTYVTNRISTGTTLTGIVFTADSGSGPQPILVQPTLASPSSIVYGGVALAFSPQGTLTLHLAGIRGDANLLPTGTPFLVALAVNAPLAFTAVQIPAGTAQTSLYVAYSAKIICAQRGSPLPNTIDFSELIAAGTAFASTRVTEGFADAFQPRNGPANLNADTGYRILIRYSGFPQGARLFVPDAVAGSDALQATAGGDFELPESGGAYAPSASGSLLLARVAGADSNGAGGTPVYTPGAIGSGTVVFNSVSELSFNNGSFYAVYEVMDANPSVQETAQFPTFLGLAPNGNATPAQTSEEVFAAPQSTAIMATATDPIPRFTAVTPPVDCQIIGDCSTYLPRLSVDTTPLQFTAQAGSPFQEVFVTPRDNGGGTMPWTATINFTSGTGWLSLNPYSGIQSTSFRADVLPMKLSPGKYEATIHIDAGSAGAADIPVTLNVTQPTPKITSIQNAASFATGPVVPGSLTSIFGSGLSGANVSVAFDGQPAKILFNNGTQINLLVPASISAPSLQLVVTVNGLASAAQTVDVAPFAPGIFSNGVLNQDSTVNGSNNPAATGSVIQIFATGLSGSGTISAHIADRDIPMPEYAGPAPGFPGVQQVNVSVPPDLPAMTTQVYICGTSPGEPPKTICSVPVPLAIH
ncbi:MAG: hypothetical protein ACRD30_01280 [Bryobacteraceae bacterium]